MSVADKTHDAAEKGDVDRNTSGSASGSYTRDGGDGTNAIGLLQGEPLRRQYVARCLSSGLSLSLLTFFLRQTKEQT